jgi:hypothetical protein
MTSTRWAKAQRYRNRAEECLRLAELLLVPEIAQHYRRISEHYLDMAEAEEAIATKGSIDRANDPTAEPGL